MPTCLLVVKHHGRRLHPASCPFAHLREPVSRDTYRLGARLCSLVLYVKVRSGDVPTRRRRVVPGPWETTRAPLRVTPQLLRDLTLLSGRLLRPIVIGIERLRTWTYPAVRIPISVSPYCFFREVFSTSDEIRRAFDLYFSPRHVHPLPSFSTSPIFIPMSIMEGSS